MNSDSNPWKRLARSERVFILLCGLGLILLACLDTPIQAFAIFVAFVAWIGIGGMFLLPYIQTELRPEERPRWRY